MRRAAARFLQHFLAGERKKFLIPRRPPRKSIDAKEAEDVIDAEDVENLAHAAHALPPPGEIVRPHRLPVVKRNAPVLSPLDRELVVFEIRLGRRAAAPIQTEVVRPAKNIRAIQTNTERNVAHQGDAALVRVTADVAPLLVRDPL